MASPASSSRRRSGPALFAREVLSELRSARWPSRRVAVRSTLLVLSALVALSLSVWGLDVLFSGMLSRLFSEVSALPAFLLGPLLVVHVTSVVFAVWALLRHPAPSGGVDLFGGGSSETASGVTPSERRRDRLTVWAVSLLVLSSLLLGLALQ